MISIIIPAYNAEKTIGRALATATAQTYKDIDIIVVDDGSTDNTYDVIESFRRKDKRVVPYSYPSNKGVSHARNRGIELARGNLIYFLDADDYMAPGAIEILYGKWRENCFFMRSGIPMIVGGAVREPSGDYHGPAYVPSNVVMDKEKIFDCVYDYIETNHVYFVSHCWGRLYERAFIGLTRFDETVKLGEDGIFNLRLFAKSNAGAVIVNQPLYHFQQQPSSSNKPLNSISVEHDLLALYKELLTYFYRVPECIDNHIASLFISQLIRARGTTVSEVRSLLSSDFVQTVLRSYHPKPTQSKIIPILMRMRLAWLTLYFCKRRNK